MSIAMRYHSGKKRAVYTFHNGRTLVVRGLTAEKAQAFLEHDAPEFEKRNCCLTSSGSQIRGIGK
jgi:hypothetical protein